MEMDQTFKGNITKEQMYDEMKATLNSLRNHIIENPENASIITGSLSEILANANKNANVNAPASTAMSNEDKELVTQMQEKLKPYLKPDPKITDYRKLGEDCSKDSNIPLPEVMLKKANLMKWFHTHFDRLQPFLHPYDPNMVK